MLHVLAILLVPDPTLSCCRAHNVSPAIFINFSTLHLLKCLSRIRSHIIITEASKLIANLDHGSLAKPLEPDIYMVLKSRGRFLYLAVTHTFPLQVLLGPIIVSHHYTSLRQT